MKARTRTWIGAPLFAIGLLFSGFGLTGCGSDEHAASEDSEDHAEEEVDHMDEPVHMTAEEITEFDIEVRTAGPGALTVTRSFPGEVRANQDRYAHVVPRVSGVVKSVRKSVGDDVRAGEVMAILESRELADVKASYLANSERLELAQASFDREQRLFDQKISAEQEFLEARQALAEARIVLRSDKQKLRALGFSDETIEALPGLEDASLIDYPLLAPFDGTVLERHVVQGEALRSDASAFDVANLSQVWVDLSIYQSDLALIREGQAVVISAGHGLPDAVGSISYVRPIVGEETRTALARIVLPNPDGLWRPGMFVSGAVSTSSVEVAVSVPTTALHLLEGQLGVFVRTVDGFQFSAVSTGRENGTQVEITSGLEAGEEYAARGGFVLKSQMGKAELSDGHNH